MAAFETTHPVNGTDFGARFGSLLASVVDWNDKRVTRNALSKLTNRELDDIGLTRGDIEGIKA
ncbi:MAG: DUF1127 domain-containing protein [Pseudoruegeria sp.]